MLIPAMSFQNVTDQPVESELLHSIDENRPSTDGEASAVATSSGAGTIRNYHADAKGVEARAKAKAEAKARLR